MKSSRVSAGEVDGAGGETPRTSHLLIVAGPSGVGKSTLMARLARHDIPPALLAHLPGDVSEWPQLLAADINKVTPEQAAGFADGLVLHYNLTRCIEFGGFRGDPALSLIERADRVTVVSLVASPERVATQLVERYIRASAGRSRLRVHAAILRISVLSALISKLQWFTWLVDEAEALARSHRVPDLCVGWLRRYWLRAWLAGCYDEWRAFAVAVIPPEAQHIYLEPARSLPFARYEWRLRLR